MDRGFSLGTFSSRRGGVTSALTTCCLRGNSGAESRDSAAFHKRIVSQTGSHYANNPRYTCEFIIVHNHPYRIYVFQKMKTLLLLLNLLFFTFACRDKLDRYSHSSIDRRSIKIHFYSSYLDSSILLMLNSEKLV